MSDIEFKKLQIIQENLRINGMTLVDLFRQVAVYSFEDYLRRLEDGRDCCNCSKKLYRLEKELRRIDQHGLYSHHKIAHELLKLLDDET